MQSSNRLTEERSPYLRQHGHNPVDWYPWGPEALERARREARPIFLSIGYSTCHWCHVMERESFENEEIARILNANFVPIKVDREERPDLDHLYMTAVQGMTGHGGWPMTVFLTPELQPFHAGTYFPPEDRGGMPGFPRVLSAVLKAWQERREEVQQSAARITEFLQDEGRAAARERGGIPPVELLDRACEQLAGTYDAEYGGFGGAPKVPSPHQLTFLLRYAARTGFPAPREMACHTLEAMWNGGIHDHLGGGFARYSTDREWLAPHFEKMLYDQALLLDAFTEAWLATRREVFAEGCRDIAGYVLRDLTSPQGGFHTAEDADSEGVEGRFYVWSLREVQELLGPERAAEFCSIYDVTEAGNWEGSNILRYRPGTTFESLGATPGLSATLAKDRARLLEARSMRVRPGLDDKVVTGWNGLMLGAMARAGASLGEPAWVEAAQAAAEFVEARLARDGRLLRRWHSGEAAHPAFLEDYAFLAHGLLELHQATLDLRWLERSLHYIRELELLFGDSHAGGYFFSGTGNEVLLARHKDVHDGATPSGNSMAACVLLRLGDLTADTELSGRGRRLLQVFGGVMEEIPRGSTQMLQALDFHHGPTTQVILSGERGSAELDAMLEVVRAHHDPRRGLLLRPEGEEARAEALAPYLQQYARGTQPATAYVCRNYTCQLPVHAPADLERALTQAG